MERVFDLRLFNWARMEAFVQSWTVKGAYSQALSGTISLVLETPLDGAVWIGVISDEFPNALELRRIRGDIYNAWLNCRRNDSFEVAGAFYNKLNHLYWEKDFPAGCQYALLGLLRYEAWRKENPRCAWVLDQLGNGSQRHDYTRYVFEANSTWQALWHVADALEWATRQGLNLDPFTAWDRWRSSCQ